MSTPAVVAVARAALVAGTGQTPEQWAALWAAYWAARGQVAPPAEAPLNWHKWQDDAEARQEGEAA